MRPLLYGPDGNTPVAFEKDKTGDGNEPPSTIDKALLVEFFGTLMCWQQTFEWPKHEGGLNEAMGRMLDVIVDRVGPEVLNTRFGKYGCKIGPMPKTEAPAPMPEKPWLGAATREDLEGARVDGARAQAPANPYADLNKGKTIQFPTKAKE